MFPVESVAIAGMPKPASTATAVKDFVGFVIGAAGAANVTAAVPKPKLPRRRRSDRYRSSRCRARRRCIRHRRARCARRRRNRTARRACAICARQRPRHAKILRVVRYVRRERLRDAARRNDSPRRASPTRSAGDGGRGVNVIVAFADFVVSSTDVAVSVTVGGFGTAAGAVYITAVPDAAVVPDKVPQAAPVHPGSRKCPRSSHHFSDRSIPWP